MSESTPTQAVEAPPAPNIVLVLMDDAATGQEAVLDAVRARVADRGVTLTNLMMPTPLCCPSRSSLLTGMYSRDTQVRSNNGDWGGWPRFIDDERAGASIASILKPAGYRTGMFGKYLNQFDNRGPDSQPSALRPLASALFDEGYVPRDWDVFTAFASPSNRYGYYYDYDLRRRYDAYSDPAKVSGDVQIRRATDGLASYSTNVLADEAVDFITSTPEDMPLFAYVAPFGPHYPFSDSTTPADSNGQLMAPLPEDTAGVHVPWVPTTFKDRPRWMRDATNGRSDFDVADQQRAALLHVKAVDQLADSVIDALEATGRLENTLIIVMSDNGYMWGELGLNGKSVPYDKSTRVPGFVRWDAGVQRFPILAPGTVSDRLTANVDITATIVDAAGLAQEARVVAERVYGRAPRGTSLLRGSRTERLSFYQTPYVPLEGRGSREGHLVFSNFKVSRFGTYAKQRGDFGIPNPDAQCSGAVEGDTLNGQQLFGCIEKGRQAPAYIGLRMADELYLRWATGEEEYYRYAGTPVERCNLAYTKRWDSRVSFLRSEAQRVFTPLAPGSGMPNLDRPRKVIPGAVSKKRSGPCG